jgi:hypothetical protein
MSFEVTVIQREQQVLNDITKLGLYKLLFSAKVAFCFVILLITTCFMTFSAWAVCKHVLDSTTFGVCFGVFGGIMATIAGVYNIVHSMNDRAAIQAAVDAGAATPPPANVTVVNTTNTLPPPAPPPPPADPDTSGDDSTDNLTTPPPDANLPPSGTL